MKAKIPEKLWKAMGGLQTFKHYGITTDRELGWRKYAEIDLEQITPKRLLRLAETVAPHSSIKGAAMLLKDIRAWARISAKDHTTKPRTVEQFAAMLRAYLQDVPGHRVYERDESSEVMWPYYVERVVYHPPQQRRGGDYDEPPSVTMALFWFEFGTRRKAVETFHAEDCLHLTVAEALTKRNYYAENDFMREEYLADIEKHRVLEPQIGLQLLGRGKASDSLDGNPSQEWSWYKSDIILDHDGTPARLLVDVYKETDKEDQSRHENSVDLWFWNRKTMSVGTSDEDGEDDSNDDLNDDAEEEDDQRSRKDLDIEDVEERPEIEIPIHPVLAVFDLRRHLRLSVHVGAVEIYAYDTDLAKKLVLPEDTISLVEILISGSSAFKDIVANKGGGSVILCAGPAGVGKTLTAEVYSEATQRPLYSVQCAQLGVSPEKLESELSKIFARAQRWNAIALLDEADVYVMARGKDLRQNAIVGVFLRMLEYYNGTLFMTTNRANSVDDAIASRCVARINYTLPSVEHQIKLWRILSDTAGVAITDQAIDTIVARHDCLSGRDIKNLIKLASAVSVARGVDIDVGLIDFVKRFKPTTDIKSAKASGSRRGSIPRMPDDDGRRGRQHDSLCPHCGRGICVGCPLTDDMEKPNPVPGPQ